MITIIIVITTTQDHKKQSQFNAFENNFRYEIEEPKPCNYYFNQDITNTEFVYNRLLAASLKKACKAIKTLDEYFEDTVVLYGPINNFINKALPKNTYIYCNSASDAPFEASEIDFINNTFNCCIVPTETLKHTYISSGINILIKVIQPGLGDSDEILTVNQIVIVLGWGV